MAPKPDRATEKRRHPLFELSLTRNAFTTRTELPSGRRAIRAGRDVSDSAAADDGDVKDRNTACGQMTNYVNDNDWIYG